MNILPLIFSFLWVFAILAASFTRQSMQTQIEKTAYQGVMTTKLIGQNLVEQERFTQAKGEEKEEKKTNESKKKTMKNVTFRSFREKKRCDIEASKFNLHALVTIKSPVLYECAAKLIRTLYGNASFFKSYPEKEWEYRVLDTLILAASKQESASSLLEILPKEELADPLFYKMFRGTKKYNFYTGKGYPPFHHFFTFLKEEKAAICFPRASKAVLEAYFGASITASIIEKEKEKWEKDHKTEPLKEEELRTLLGKKFSFEKKNKESLEGIGFSSPKKKRKKVYVEDPKTGISAEVALRE